MITLEDIKKNSEIQELMMASQRQLNVLGYTEHCLRHTSIVSNRAGQVLEALRLL